MFVPVKGQVFPDELVDQKNKDLRCHANIRSQRVDAGINSFIERSNSELGDATAERSALFDRLVELEMSRLEAMENNSIGASASASAGASARSRESVADFERDDASDVTLQSRTQSRPPRHYPSAQEAFREAQLETSRQAPERPMSSASSASPRPKHDIAEHDRTFTLTSMPMTSSDSPPPVTSRIGFGRGLHSLQAGTSEEELARARRLDLEKKRRYQQELDRQLAEKRKLECSSRDTRSRNSAPMVNEDHHHNHRKLQHLSNESSLPYPQQTAAQRPAPLPTTSMMPTSSNRYSSRGGPPTTSSPVSSVLPMPVDMGEKEARALQRKKQEEYARILKEQMEERERQQAREKQEEEEYERRYSGVASPPGMYGASGGGFREPDQPSWTANHTQVGSQGGLESIASGTDGMPDSRDSWPPTKTNDDRAPAAASWHSDNNENIGNSSNSNMTHTRARFRFDRLDPSEQEALLRKQQQQQLQQLSLKQQIEENERRAEREKLRRQQEEAIEEERIARELKELQLAAERDNALLSGRSQHEASSPPPAQESTTQVASLAKPSIDDPSFEADPVLVRKRREMQEMRRQQEELQRELERQRLELARLREASSNEARVSPFDKPMDAQLSQSARHRSHLRPRTPVALDPAFQSRPKVGNSMELERTGSPALKEGNGGFIPRDRDREFTSATNGSSVLEHSMPSRSKLLTIPDRAARGRSNDVEHNHGRRLGDTWMSSGSREKGPAASRKAALDRSLASVHEAGESSYLDRTMGSEGDLDQTLRVISRCFVYVSPKASQGGSKEEPNVLLFDEDGARLDAQTYNADVRASQSLSGSVGAASATRSPVAHHAGERRFHLERGAETAEYISPHAGAMTPVRGPHVSDAERDSPGDWQMSRHGARPQHAEPASDMSDFEDDDEGDHDSDLDHQIKAGTHAGRYERDDTFASFDQTPTRADRLGASSFGQSAHDDLGDEDDEDDVGSEGIADLNDLEQSRVRTAQAARMALQRASAHSEDEESTRDGTGDSPAAPRRRGNPLKSPPELSKGVRRIETPLGQHAFSFEPRKATQKLAARSAKAWAQPSFMVYRNEHADAPGAGSASGSSRTASGLSRSGFGDGAGKRFGASAGMNGGTTGGGALGALESATRRSSRPASARDAANGETYSDDFSNSDDSEDDSDDEYVAYASSSEEAHLSAFGKELA
ncbi:Hypothetical Protein FCC1311_044082 [Hondaea fermentalgiana]|uniref:Uncharacterized protein n=1 Tax=Hondaea fermentalgiana TaxID=2315210 RepID=A0A2R5GCA3_9STRA|nr:Hypothetical Protein FCC1311_044082 [Hondaea fermentalgiana]|eukprot:GBG28185.1 Hypothetical Protein FCC1311_044082 [Hondaea fermentalgiana]